MTTKAQALKNLYVRVKIEDAGLKKAVVDGVITPTEYKEITGDNYTPIV
jgi:hypothetical protein